MYYKWRDHNEICDKYLHSKKRTFFCPNLNCCGLAHTNRFLLVSVIIFIIFSLLLPFVDLMLLSYVITAFFVFLLIYGSIGVLLIMSINDMISIRTETVMGLVVMLATLPIQMIFADNLVPQVISTTFASVAQTSFIIITPVASLYHFQKKLYHYKLFKFLFATQTDVRESYLPSATISMSTTPLEFARPSCTVSINEQNPDQSKYPVRLIDFLKKGSSEYSIFAEFLVKCFASEVLFSFTHFFFLTKKIMRGIRISTFLLFMPINNNKIQGVIYHFICLFVFLQSLLYFQWVVIFRNYIVTHFHVDNQDVNLLDYLFDIDLTHLAELQETIKKTIGDNQTNVHKVATQILDTFIVPGSLYEINISFVCRKQIEAFFTSKENPQSNSLAEYCELFVDALGECYQLMNGLYASNFPS
ncbi:hypothetical protein RFI_11077 [Reticulomyxa filosa]|uniref:Uncharacterized protein n=1 Tax=Reticulomyxa filosa TaxID=46433 RepID=X6NJG6_RETFI|nr:hypothetical protein RFI_11077 [Reticulomyxa filosa]|eukprot:ETO26063.1 hypothetical protein RFI_11077 [Reticulomyxa filosa]